LSNADLQGWVVQRSKPSNKKLSDEELNGITDSTNNRQPLILSFAR